MTTLQDCVKESVSKGDAPLPIDGQFNLRVNTEMKEVVDDICRNHSTNLSLFLRKCMENLVRDYRDAKP